MTVGRKSKLPLYRSDIATMEGGESIYNQNDATGSIELQRPPPPREGDGGETDEEEGVAGRAAVRLSAGSRPWNLLQVPA